MLTEHINRDIARGTKNLQISCLIWASLLLEAPAHLPPEISHKPIKADIIIHKNPQHQRFHISQGTKVYSHLWPKKHYFFLGIAFEALALIYRPPMWFLRKTHLCIDCSLCASINLKWMKNANYFYVLQSEKWSIEPGCASGWRNWHTDVSPRTQFNKGDFFWLRLT